MGLSDDRVSIAPSDSLNAPPPFAVSDSSLTAVATLQVAAAEAALEATRLAIRAQRRGLFGMPALIVGVETGDPSGSEPGILPTFGIALPFPLFNFNRGPVRLAEAEQERARAELSLVQATTKADLARTLVFFQPRFNRSSVVLAHDVHEIRQRRFGALARHLQQRLDVRVGRIGNQGIVQDIHRQAAHRQADQMSIVFRGIRAAISARR